MSKRKAEVIIEEEVNSDSDDQSESINDVSIEPEMNTESEIDEEGNSNLNEKWADSIAKILKCNKPKKKRTVVLSKAKKLTDPVKIIKTDSFEIASTDGQVRKETITKIESKTNKKKILKKTKKELPIIRVKPDILQKGKERLLQKIATRGVVQLFNTVKTQQKDIEEKLKEAGPLEVRKDKVLKEVSKSSFLDTLMSEPSVKISSINKNDEF